MEDNTIIQLYFDRDERAISCTDEKYGALCTRIAKNIVQSREDAEECVSDTWHTAWCSMPPTWPESLRAFLSRITRNLAISRVRQETAQKRGGTQLLCELSDCVPDTYTPERLAVLREITDCLSCWLESLSPDDRALFVRRYYFGDDLKTLGICCGQTERQLAQRMLRLRRKLKKTLEQEGIAI